LLRYFSALSSEQKLIAGGNTALRERTASMLAHLIRTFRAWLRYEASLRELSRLGDRELADIGVVRSDIPRIAWETARA
jgi:uncharacterized protein YjiS (DUF1127 family)